MSVATYEDPVIKQETMENTVEVEHNDTKPSLEDSEDQSSRDHVKDVFAEDKLQSNQEE